MKVVDLDISTWNYKHDEEYIRHIGPMTQDFRAAFELGENDTTIAAMDKDGVALASIQGLNKRLEEKEAKIRHLEESLEEQVAKNVENERRLQAMEEAISRLAPAE